MVLKSTYTIETVQELNSLHGMDTLIQKREENRDLKIAGLVHEFEILSIKLRELNERTVEPAKYAYDEYEFTPESLIRAKGPTTYKHIQKVFKRWEDVKKLIKEIDPEFFLSFHEKIANSLSKKIQKEIDDEIIKQIIAKGSPSCPN